MFGNKVKNFKLAPTSELVFYIVNNDQTDFSASKLHKILTERLTRKYNLDAEKANSIAERDVDIIISRGNDLSNYVFDYSRGLRGTEEALYKNLNTSEEECYKSRLIMTDTLSSERLEGLTLSELCLGVFLETKFKELYRKRGKLLKEQIQQNRKSISDRGVSILDESIQREISDEKSLYELQRENKNMEKFHGTLLDEFAVQFMATMYDLKELENCSKFRLTASALNVLCRERRFCITGNRRRLKQESADFKDLSSDVASLDKQIISNNEEASKVYRLATHSIL